MKNLLIATLLSVMAATAQTKLPLDQLNGGKVIGLVFIDTNGKMQPVKIGEGLILVAPPGSNPELRVLVPAITAPPPIASFFGVDPTRNADGTLTIPGGGILLNTLQVWRNGILQKVKVDYSVVIAANGLSVTITPVIPWTADDILQAAYQRQ